ncbi:2343_t:CDS:1 [Gigaspora margarita]|uniref:2343_t:CDS:1 n=1 Tax=Gigaspora margarita TaxID=4874 RepID=A0ABN7UW35_GIGMA|nr:2343_t:CDS:1 [Gigaspora margarita]
MAFNKSILISFVLVFSIFLLHVLAIPSFPETQNEPDTNVPLPSNVTEIKFEDLPSSGELYKLTQNPTFDETDNNSESEQITINSQLDSTESNENSITRRNDESEKNVVDSDPHKFKIDSKNPHTAPANSTNTINSRVQQLFMHLIFQ